MHADPRGAAASSNTQWATHQSPIFLLESFIMQCCQKYLGSVDVSFTAAFGPVLGLNKEKIATWYEYHQRFLTPCSPKNGLNPKG
jgi:hypothetical protein